MVAPTPPPPTVDRVELELAITRSSMTMAERGEVLVGLRVINHTRLTINPDISNVDCFVNGSPDGDINFRAAAMNGAIDDNERALPGHMTFEKKWPLAELLFPHPGDYTVVLKRRDLVSKPVKIHIDP